MLRGHVMFRHDSSQLLRDLVERRKLYPKPVHNNRLVLRGYVMLGHDAGELLWYMDGGRVL